MNFGRPLKMLEPGDTYFKIYRKIYDNGLWTDPITLRLFVWILGHAVYDVKGLTYSNVIVNRGQYLRSYRKLQEDLEYVHNRQIKKHPLSTISRAVDKLIDYQIITKLDTELGTLFTVINYDKYQPLFSNKATYDEVEAASSQELGTEPGTTCEQPANNNKKDKKVKELYSPNSEELRLATLLFDLIRQRNPKHKEPDFQKWAKQIELLIKLDKRTETEIETVIRCCQEDSFWQNNILSTQNLRKNFDRLFLQMQNKGQVFSGSKPQSPHTLNNFTSLKQVTTGV